VVEDKEEVGCHRNDVAAATQELKRHHILVYTSS
jgi:hypothetical protein